MRPRCEIPAVVVGGSLNSLGVVRSLAQAGLAVHVLGTSRACAAGWSRHSHFVCTPSLEGEPLVRSLVELASRLQSRPVLILTADESVETLSEQRALIEPLYRLSLPTHEMVRTLSDKIFFQQFAEREGFPVPRGLALAHPRDIGHLATLTPPLVLKPASKLLVLKGMAERAVRAETLSQAQAAAAALMAGAARVLAQEWIDGADDDLFFTLFSCDRSGRLLGLFTGRKLICSPPAIGSTAICISAPEADPILAEQTRLFITKTHYRGLGSLEFKHDRSTGRYLIVEPTVGRTDWQEEIATLCGINLPLLTYQAECADSAANSGQLQPLRRHHRQVAWRASIEHRRALRSPRTASVDGFFRWSDPLPAIYYYGFERGALRLWRRCNRLLTRPRHISTSQAPPSDPSPHTGDRSPQ